MSSTLLVDYEFQALIPQPEATPNNDREVALMAKVVLGDRQAFVEIFQIFAPKALGLLVRILGRRGLAEEVLQEVFLHVWTQAASYRPERGRPGQWILTLARSRGLDRLRIERSRGQREEAFDEVSRTGAPGNGDDGRDIRKALELLSPEQRVCVELAYFEGMTHTEIAARLGAPLGTVKSRILLGMGKMREALREIPLPVTPPA